MVAGCSICTRIEDWQAGTNPAFIHEFPRSIWVVGDHQFFPGYTMILLKDHVRELHDLPRETRLAFFDEVMTAGAAVAWLLRPWKMNYGCYGNLDPHLHWHLIPRRQEEPDRTALPWAFASEFGKHVIGAEAAQEIAKRLEAALGESVLP